MYSYIDLLVFNPLNSSLNARICSILNESHLTFKFINSVDAIITEAIKGNCYAIIAANNNETYSHLSAATLPTNSLDNVHVIYSNDQATIPQFPIYYNEKTLHNLTLFLSSITPLQIPSFINKIVSIELEKLNLSKKYTAFKYIVDIICRALYSNNFDPFSTNTLRHIAFINHTSWTNVERDIRHMLTCNFDSNPTFATTIHKLANPDTEINTKVLLLCLIKHIKSAV